MHPIFLEMIANDKAREIERAAASYHRRHPQPDEPNGEQVALRLDRIHDHKALLLLAARDGRTLPMGPFVVGEVGGKIVAALSLKTGDRLADPSRPTSHILSLLALRASQIAPRHSVRTRFARRLNPSRS
jgi:hypothetical protein